MAARILVACLLGLAVSTANAASLTDARSSRLLVAEGTDGLYDALLKSIPAALPQGVGGAQVAPVAMDDDDRGAGVRGIAQVTFQSKDPLLKINYVVLGDASEASAYIRRYLDLIGSSGARQIMLPYLPQADCAANATDSKMICGMAVDRVVIFSFGTEAAGTNTTGPTSLAGPLIKAARDHLTRVKTASGKT